MDEQPPQISPEENPDASSEKTSSADTNPPVEEVVLQAIECWRCGKLILTSDRNCPICRAAARHEIPENGQPDPGLPSNSAARQRRRSEDSGEATMPLVQVLYFFLIFLGLSVVFRLIVVASVDRLEGIKLSEALRQLVTGFDVVSSILVIVAWLKLPRPPSLPKKSHSQVFLGWVLGIPMLLGALAINFAYHALLMNYLRAPEWMLEDELYLGATVTWLVLAICVQPALFEELFFRGLTLGHLRSEMGDHGAVWVSSLMFGLAHLGTPLSMPALIVVGVALGYARIWSGSLLLPMLMHAAHNGVVIYTELMK